MTIVESQEGPNHANLTDEDANLLSTRRGGFITGYNAQAMASPISPSEKDGGGGLLITAVGVSSDSDDHPQLVPMIEAAAENIDTERDVVTVADAGYHSGANLAACAESGHEVVMAEAQDRKRRSPYHKDHFIYRAETDTFVCQEGKTLRYESSFRHRSGYRVRRYRASGADCRACPAFGVCTRSNSGRSIRISEYEPIIRRHRQKMASDGAKKLHRRRQQIVEPVFGLLKENHGARRFLLRGREQVLSEWSLLTTAFNLKSLHRVWKRGAKLTALSASGWNRRMRCLMAIPRLAHRKSLHFLHMIRHSTKSLIHSPSFARQQ